MTNTHGQRATFRFGAATSEAAVEGRTTRGTGVPFRRVLFVFFGGFGNKSRRALERLAKQMGIEISAIAIDAEASELADVPRDRRVQLHTTSLAELSAYPALRKQYLERPGMSAAQLQRIEGVGASGIPEIAAIDFNMSISELRVLFRRALLGIAAPPDRQKRNPFLDLDADREADPVGTVQVICVGGGAGSVGAASLLLAPPLLRQIAREVYGLHTELYIAAVVAGPDFYRGRATPTDKVWASTMAQIAEACLEGPTLSFIDGSTITDLTPIYQRVFLVDAAIEGIEASESEEHAFHADVARLLYALATAGATGLTGEIEGAVVGHQVYPALTACRVVLPFVPQAHDAVADALVANALATFG